ncbi:MAG: GNAT family N-acetyltransferase [Bacteroidetes bacterium]|nr:GNAT family N-acetyltransferase [Bacteroidota bacterium]
MKVKLLHLDEYNEYFNFTTPETGSGIEHDRDSGDNYFFIQIFLPVKYFDLDPFLFTLNPFIREHDVPDSIHIKFELFGIGKAGMTRSFIFKPWIINVNNPAALRHFEDFLLYIPEKIFFNLSMRLIFIEQFSLPQLKKVRVYEDISDLEFIQFGLHRQYNPPSFETERLLITEMWSNPQDEIEKFYKKNDSEIEDRLLHKYFRQNLNKWYSINNKDYTERYGYLRIYNSDSSYNGGVFVEYIVEKKFRNQGIATEALTELIGFMEEHSFAFTMSAEVNTDNKASIKVLENCEFEKIESKNSSLRNNFTINLIREQSLRLESDYQDGFIEFRIETKYGEKFQRYLS